MSSATIKYYIREGLLPAGRPVTARQAEYGEEHLSRLRLVRALIDVGGLSVRSVRDVLEAMDGPDGVRKAVGVAHKALPPRPATGGDLVRAHRALEALGWHPELASSAMHQLEAALAAAEAVGLEPSPERLRTYADAAMTIAELEVSSVSENGTGGGDAGESVRYVVLGTVLYEPLLLSLRRLAHGEIFQRGHRD